VKSFTRNRSKADRKIKILNFKEDPKFTDINSGLTER